VWLDGYVSNLRGLLYELIESLSSDDVDALRNELDADSSDKWIKFLNESADTIKSFQLSPPSKRDKLKKFQPPSLKRKLVLAAYQNLRAGHLMLEVLSQHPCEGLSYRDAGVQAAQNAKAMYAVWPYDLWPFDHEPPRNFRVDEDFRY